MSEQDDFGESDSRNAVNIFIDAPGNQPIRPCPPELRPIMEALRKKYYEALSEEGPPPDLDPIA